MEAPMLYKLIDIMIADPIFCCNWQPFCEALGTPHHYLLAQRWRHTNNELDFKTMWTDFMKRWLKTYPNRKIGDLCGILIEYKFRDISDSISTQYTENTRIILPNNGQLDARYFNLRLNLQLSTDFVGRKQQLDILRRSHTPVIIWGIGGVGTSQLAYYYAQEFEKRIYLNCESEVSFTKSLMNYTECFRLPCVSLDEDPNKLLEVVHEIIVSLNVKQTLLILDNVRDLTKPLKTFLTALVSYAMREANIYLIATCRYKFVFENTAACFTYIQLDTFLADETEKFLWSKLGSMYSKADVKDLCPYFYNFPPLIKQGIAYIVENNIEIHNYIAKIWSQTNNNIHECNCDAPAMTGFKPMLKSIRRHGENGETAILLLKLLSIIEDPDGETRERINRLYDTISFPERVKSFPRLSSFTDNLYFTASRDATSRHYSNQLLETEFDLQMQINMTPRFRNLSRARTGFHYDGIGIEKSVNEGLAILGNYSALKYGYEQSATRGERIRLHELFKHITVNHNSNSLSADRKKYLLKMVRSSLHNGFLWIKYDLNRIAVTFWEQLTRPDSALCITSNELDDLKPEFCEIWKVNRGLSAEQLEIQFDIFLHNIRCNFDLAAIFLKTVLVRFMEYNSAQSLSYCKSLSKIYQEVQIIFSRDTPSKSVLSVFVDNINSQHFIEARVEKEFPYQFAQRVLLKAISHPERLVFKVHFFVSVISYYNRGSWREMREEAFQFLSKFFGGLEDNEVSKGTILFFLRLAISILKNNQLSELTTYCSSMENKLVKHASELDLILLAVKEYISNSTRISFELELDVFYTTPFKNKISVELLHMFLTKTGQSSHSLVHNLFDKILQSINFSAVQMADNYLSCRVIINWLKTFGFGYSDIVPDHSDGKVVARVLKSRFLIGTEFDEYLREIIRSHAAYQTVSELPMV